ncbi:hypothetical protein ABZ281_33440 [Streptomyces sp. NPDC006265]|uniref:hypothetical protein n=1 Tax=Streptomyces sp. NPDC006265 TaxID=3156740 RepID=UPI0033AC44B8
MERGADGAELTAPPARNARTLGTLDALAADTRQPGAVVVADSGSVGAVRLKLDGAGDASLLVGAGQEGTTSLNRKQISDLTEARAEQVH